jgi:hypothetical protein
MAAARAGAAAPVAAASTVAARIGVVVPTAAPPMEGFFTAAEVMAAETPAFSGAASLSLSGADRGAPVFSIEEIFPAVPAASRRLFPTPTWGGEGIIISEWAAGITVERTAERETIGLAQAAILAISRATRTFRAEDFRIVAP